MTNELISMPDVEDRLTAQDDPGAWKEILAVVGEEFLLRYRVERREKESWFCALGHVRIGYGPTSFPFSLRLRALNFSLRNPKPTA